MSSIRDPRGPAVLEQDQGPSFISEASALNPERHESCVAPLEDFLLRVQSTSSEGKMFGCATL